MPCDARLPTTEKGCSPVDEVGMEISGGDGVKEESMIDTFKRFSNVSRDGGSSERWLFSLKPAAMRVTRGRSAEDVEWLERKPCCHGESFREALK